MSLTAADPPDDWWVICLCAQWCGVCRDYRAPFDRAFAANPQARFAWVDVEDESDTVGDVDVETFPTLLVGRGGQARFFGPVPPAAEQISRLLASLQSNGAAAASVNADADALLQRLLSSGLRSLRP